MRIEQTEQQINSAILSDHERNRLVRLCTRLTGDPSVADDLTQETLLTAWHRRDQVTNPTGLSHWLAAIARNYCRNWIRSRSRQQKYIAAGADFDLSTAIDPVDIADKFDLDAELEHGEIVDLLDRALGHLPTETQALLVNHYVDEVPQAELAGQLGLKAGAVAGRLNRGKTALRRLLVTEFSDDALALGLISSDSVGWETTRIWCTSCGQKKLRGQFMHNGERQMRLICSCGLHTGTQGLSKVFEGIRGYRPALTRIKQWQHTFLQAGLGRGEIDCPSCHRAVKLHITPQTPAPTCFGSRPTDEQSIWVHCTACDWGTHNDLQAIAGSFPETLTFWRKHPRTKLSPIQQLEYEGAPASLVRIHSFTDNAQLDLIFHATTFALLDSS